MPYRVQVRNTPSPARGSWATYIQTLREGLGLSKAEFGRRIGVDRATVHRWETAQTKPSDIQLLVRIASVFELEVDEVLAAAGLRPDVAPPAEPTRERDEELEMILTAPLSPALKEELIAILERERDEDRRRRMERTQQMINLYRRRSG